MAIAALCVMAFSLTSCATKVGPRDDPSVVDSTAIPTTALCRDLLPSDLAERSNATKTVPCTDPHNDVTLIVGTLPADYTGLKVGDDKITQFLYGICEGALESALGTDESTVMRSMLSWAAFRPSDTAWKDGARWYRCDLVGGTTKSTVLLDLPVKTTGLLSGTTPDEWMACAVGASVATGKVVPCSQQHSWRAVTTIKLGEDNTSYPGDAVAEAKTKQYCSDSVDAWLGYPASFDFGYTWFGQMQWDAGNRRSVCWAKTDA